MGGDLALRYSVEVVCALKALTDISRPIFHQLTNKTINVIPRKILWPVNQLMHHLGRHMVVFSIGHTVDGTCHRKWF